LSPRCGVIIAGFERGGNLTPLAEDFNSKEQRGFWDLRGFLEEVAPGRVRRKHDDRRPGVQPRGQLATPQGISTAKNIADSGMCADS
jgi:hypothetical protein